MDRAGEPLQVWVVGPGADHREFRGALALLGAGAQVARVPAVEDPALSEPAASAPPALIVIAQSRPGEVGMRDVEQLRRRFPLAGVVSLLGSWCEGELRTGRPVPGAVRLYWHEFPAWWHRQRSLLAAERCPDWIRPSDAAEPSRIVSTNGRDGKSPQSRICRGSQSLSGKRLREGDSPHFAGLLVALDAPRSKMGTVPDAFRTDSESAVADRYNGLVVLRTPRWDLAEALSDVLRAAGYATLWQAPGRTPAQFRGAAAGIWDGGQLDDGKADELAGFCGGLARDGAAVLALLDFPRHDRTDFAFRLGARAVLGMPWINAELLELIGELVNTKDGEASTNHVHVA